MSSGIPKNVLKESVPGKLGKGLVSDKVYSGLRRMIFSGKLEKGEKLLRWKFVKTYDVNESAVSEAFGRSREDGLVVTKGKKGSFVV